MPSDNTNIDGITPVRDTPPPQKSSAPKESAGTTSQARFALMTIVGVPYAIYVLWSFFLLAVLPDASGEWDILIPFGKLLAMIAALVFILAAFFGVMRIGKAANAPDSVRYMGFARVAAFALPGLLLSAIVPFWIGQEPPLPLSVTNPTTSAALVAPLSVTFSAAEAQDILRRKGLQVRSFEWDLLGDGTVNETTVVPEATGYYDRQGGYAVSVTMQLDDGTARVARHRLTIPKAVFSYTPFVPVVDEPVKFNIAHLLPQTEERIEVREVQWDFDSDGIPDETGTALQTTHTFLRTGNHTVSVTIVYTNQTQQAYERVITIEEPQPNPFPIRIETIPEFLESPPPFQVVFRLVTEEPLQEIEWDFDDATPPEVGERIGHTFRNRQVYQVRVSARNLNGDIAKASTIVKVVENLTIPDLTFDGSHTVQGDRISAEAPVAITLTPKTAASLVDFWWEAPRAAQVTSTDTILDAVYREPGKYNLILLGKDAEGRVMRKTITLDVTAKSNIVDFQVRPTQPVAPQTVMFDASESIIPGDEITGFIWNFSDGAEVEQRFGDAREEYTYTKAGEYTVTLTVNTLSGKTETVTKTFVVRAPVLKSCFTMSRTRITAPNGIVFNWGCSTGVPVRVLWKFGDGAEAEAVPNGERETDHVYERPGVFTVELYLKDANGSESTHTETVTVD